MKSLEERYSSAREVAIKAQRSLDAAKKRYREASEDEDRILAIAGLGKGSVVDAPYQGYLVRGTVLNITGEHARVFIGEGANAAIIKVLRYKLYPVEDAE